MSVHQANLPVFNHTDELTIDMFTDPKFGFTKQATVVYDDEVHTKGKNIGKKKRKTEIEFIPENTKEWTDRSEWVYIITYDGYVVKIGGTATGMKARGQSYKCGTEEYRMKGTCATTNYTVYQHMLKAVKQGVKVEIYGYKLPQQVVTVECWGSSHKIIPETYHAFESSALSHYSSVRGNFPPLSLKSGNNNVVV